MKGLWFFLLMCSICLPCLLDLMLAEFLYAAIICISHIDIALLVYRYSLCTKKLTVSAAMTTPFTKKDPVAAKFLDAVIINTKINSRKQRNLIILLFPHFN